MSTNGDGSRSQRSSSLSFVCGRVMLVVVVVVVEVILVVVVAVVVVVLVVMREGELVMPA